MNLLKGVSFFLPPPPVDFAEQKKIHQHQLRVPSADIKRVDHVPFFAGFAVAVLVVVGAIADAM
jgi:hypothetical protein